MTLHNVLPNKRHNWAVSVSPNPNVKVFVGAAASSNAAGEGYVGIDTVKAVVLDSRKKYSSFGGVMLWDASEEEGA